MNARRLASGVVLALVSSLCSAQVPSMMNYQGRLVQGTNLYNGAVGLSLQLWSAATGGSMLGEDSNTATAVDGLYATVLGDDMPADSLSRILNDNTNVYIGVLVNGVALGPRERLASAAYAVIPGLKGVGNVQAGARSAVGGGETNAAWGAVSVIGGGRANLIGTNAWEAVIGGGGRNTIEQDTIYAVIAGGARNRIAFQAYGAVIGGGVANFLDTLCGYSVIGGGWSNQVLNYADFAAIPGGRDNEAADNYALAAGRRAKARHEGAFVWADSTDSDFASTADNQFLIRASGGVGIGTNVTPAMLTVAGDILAASLAGDGSALTALNGQNIQAGTISNAALGVGSVRGTNIAASSIGPDKLSRKYWETAGNNNVTAGVHFVGTTTTNPLEFRVSNARVMRFENANVDSDPNVIGGHAYNLVTPGRVGAVIAGGGGFLDHNEVRDNYGAIGGGAGNVAGDNTSKEYATVAGGKDNTAAGGYSTVPGGSDNRASGWYSLAAGRRAQAVHDGAFVWADSTDADFSSTHADQFIVRAAGGVGLNEDDPRQQLSVGGYLDLYSGASNAPAQASIRASSLGHLFLNARSDGSTFINYDGGNSLIINPKGGRVGIGTSNPTRTLTVIGDGSFTGAVYAESFIGDGSGLTSLDGGNIMAMTVTTDQLAEAYWRLDGNANAVAGASFLGTTAPATPLELRASNTRVLLLDGTGYKVIGGSQYNSATGSATGASIGGGGDFTLPNRVSDLYGTVGGGLGNQAGNGNTSATDAPESTVGGGRNNAAAGPGSVIGGGRNNTASGTNSAIAGGNLNTAAGAVSFVGGGTNNSAAGAYAALGGGRNNTIGNEGDLSVIGGGASNYTDSAASVIGGGTGNSALQYSVVAGGQDNRAAGSGGVVGGGLANVASNSYSAVGGGLSNMVEQAYGVIAGGRGNRVELDHAFIGGGLRNRIGEGQYGVIAGGISNVVDGREAFIGGGRDNHVNSWSAIGGGENNYIGTLHGVIGGGENNRIPYDALHGTVGGGIANMASNDFSTGAAASPTWPRAWAPSSPAAGRTVRWTRRTPSPAAGRTSRRATSARSAAGSTTTPSARPPPCRAGRKTRRAATTASPRASAPRQPTMAPSSGRTARILTWIPWWTIPSRSAAWAVCGS
ncbi:MAG: hypothetical protein KA248_04540 [Kiritimatiellae bacterium]|nr:hypothetical protein [Kiritimatiellia bacterium]